MRVVLQRVGQASVVIDNEEQGAIGKGLLVLICAEPDDSDESVDYFAGKIVKMRIFNDEEGKMNRSLLDIGGEALIVSQFTLAAEWKKGNRPGFSRAAPPALGEELYQKFCQRVAALGVKVQTGTFGADMEINLTNDGPVTIIM